MTNHKVILSYSGVICHNTVFNLTKLLLDLTYLENIINLHYLQFLYL